MKASFLSLLLLILSLLCLTAITSADDISSPILEEMKTDAESARPDNYSTQLMSIEG